MKRLILLIASLTVYGVMQAQVIPGFSVGPKIGATFSRFTTDQAQIEEIVKSTFYYGAFARFGEKVYLQPEFLIMGRNGSLKDKDISQSLNSIKIRTIDVPLMLGIRLIDLKATNVRVMAGPVASLVINKTINSANWDDAITSDDIRNANWGIQFGAGADVLFLTLDFRYEIGLGDFSKLQNFNLKNNMFTIGLGWKIL